MSLTSTTNLPDLFPLYRLSNLRRTRIIFFLAITVLSFINAWILLHRNEGYKYFPFKSYSHLYVTDSAFYLKDVNFKKNTLDLSFSLTPLSRHYTLIIDDTISRGTINADSNLLGNPLLNKIHTYTLLPLGTAELAITIQVGDDKNDGDDYTNELIFYNLPGPNIAVSP